MIIRRPEPGEWNKLKDIHKPLQNQFSFPNFSKLSSVYVAVEDGEIIGFGALQPMYEAVLVLDETKSKNARIQALKLLHDQAESELSRLGVDQIHIFVQAKKFFNYMKKRFNYKSTKGIALVRKVE